MHSSHAVGHTSERGNFTLISLGQGQEGPAERALDKCMREVGWCCLRLEWWYCHEWWYCLRLRMFVSIFV